MAADAPLTAKSTVGAWLDHPIGGALIRALLAEGAQLPDPGAFVQRLNQLWSRLG